MIIPFVSCLSGFAFLIFVEAWAAPKKYVGTPTWMPYATIVAMIAFYIGAGLLFGQVAILVLQLPGALKISALVASIVGVWLAWIGLQFTQNAVRRAQKREPAKIRWFLSNK